MSPVVSIGNLCIDLVIGLALFGSIVFFVARRIESSAAAGYGRAAAYGIFILMTVANLAMVYALLTNDFGVSYVAHVGSRETPRLISAISLWSSLEGSILFWGWILSAYSAVCLYLYREKEERLMIGVGLTLMAVQIFFAILLAGPSNPFQSMVPAPENGPGPNPLLQNHWLMAVHPPCLYLGYIGFTIPFAFAVAALLETDLPGSWLALTRRWTLFAWSFQSVAIMLGGWWSYAVLGWGGYWAWDPVENASLMPWLTGTALVHSVMVQEKRKMLPVWNLTLAVVTFLLTLLGTFLTRSGVLESVHSFTESQIGPYFLGFIVIVLAASVALLLWRGPRFREAGRLENLMSLEVLFLFNNLLFVSFCFIVFLGTLYPLVVEALRGDRISVGQPYFNQMTVPITLMILLVLGASLVTPWRQGSWRGFLKAGRLPALLALITTTVAVFFGGRRPAVVLTIALTSLSFFIMLLEVIRLSPRRSFFRLLVDNPRRYGGFVAHTGALMVVVGVALSQSYGLDREVTLKPGESVEVGDYSFRLERVFAEEAPHRFEIKAAVAVSRKGRSVGEILPQMNYYPTSKEPIGTPAIRSNLVEDLYLTLMNFEKDGSSAGLRVMVMPAVAWIWIGGLTVMLGGILALALGRRAA